MNRIFGSSSSRKPKSTLQDAIASVSGLQALGSRFEADQGTQTDTRIGSIEVKIKKLDGELARYKEQMAKLRNGPGKVTFTLGLPLHRLAYSPDDTGCRTTACIADVEAEADVRVSACATGPTDI